MTNRLTLIALVLISTLPSIAARAELKNVDQVSPLVYRGARLPDEADYAALAQKYGIGVVINLEYFNDDKKEYCEKYGLKCIEFPIFLPGVWYADRIFDYGQIRKAFREVLKLSDQQGVRVYFHCYHGSDRTGTLAAALQIRQSACQGPYDKAQLKAQVAEQLKKHNFHASLYPTLLKKILSWTENVPDWICAPIQ